MRLLPNETIQKSDDDYEKYQKTRNQNKFITRVVYEEIDKNIDERLKITFKLDIGAFLSEQTSQETKNPVAYGGRLWRPRIRKKVR